MTPNGERIFFRDTRKTFSPTASYGAPARVHFFFLGTGQCPQSKPSRY